MPRVLEEGKPMITKQQEHHVMTVRATGEVRPIEVIDTPCPPGTERCPNIPEGALIGMHHWGHTGDDGTQSCILCGVSRDTGQVWASGASVSPSPPDDSGAMLAVGDPCPRCNNGYRAPEQIALVPSFPEDDPRVGVTCPNCGWGQRHNAVRGSGAVVIEINASDDSGADPDFEALLAEVTRTIGVMRVNLDALESAIEHDRSATINMARESIDDLGWDIIMAVQRWQEAKEAREDGR